MVSVVRRRRFHVVIDALRDVRRLIRRERGKGKGGRGGGDKAVKPLKEKDV